MKITERTKVSDLVDEDGVLWVTVEPGPGMRWFQQGFFMGLGFAAATAVIWVVIAVVLAAVLSG
ncbi:MAG: hypothetical protein A2Z17_06845 [Gammaproteobacteria bacterium RBG_16_66_13]|nr:MAG: hypothetical protein A2Z17_06845 [Gammaproteobacteria bacterium RBG_16_66_13]